MALAALLHGDLGVSLFTRLPVLDLVSQRIEPTLALATVTMMFAVATALPLGILAAWKVGTWIDHGRSWVSPRSRSRSRSSSIGYGLVYGLSLKWRLLPVQGYPGLAAGGLRRFSQHPDRLPAVPRSASIFMALLAGMTRSTMIEELLGEDYIRTARRRRARHQRRYCSGATSPLRRMPRCRSSPRSAPASPLLIGGVVVTESVFAIPGVGRAHRIDAVTQRDYPVIQGVILLSSFAYVAVNLLIDLSYGLFDPRIRTTA